MANFKKKKSDPFENLDSDYKDTIVSLSVEEINKRIAEVAKNQEENLKLMKDDQDLNEKKEAAKCASDQYREATKMNRLRILYAMRVISDKGGK